MKLISMTDFVLEQNKLLKKALDAYDQYCKMVNYANFLKQPLKLEMFVPCDKDGNVLEIPTKENSNNTIDHDNKLIDYNNSKEKVLFEGFTFKEETKDLYFLLEEGVYTHVLTKIRPRTIENLVGMDKLTLTQSAIKQLKNK